MQQLSTGLQSREIDSIVQAAQRVAIDHSLVLTFCNSAYLPVLERWFGKAKQSGIQALLLVSFDAKTTDFCREHGIGWTEAEIPFPSDLGGLWRYRLEVIHRILCSGLSVLHSDIDAYWLSNPMPRLLADNSDIVATQGTYYPRDVFDQTGLVLCCGFIYYRSSSATIRCLAELCEMTIDSGDNQDQAVLNRWLLEQGLHWQIPQDMSRALLPIPGSEILFTGYEGDLLAVTNEGLRVRLLAQRDFQRVLDTNTRPLVSHLYVPKQSEAKIDSFTLLEKFWPTGS